MCFVCRVLLRGTEEERKRRGATSSAVVEVDLALSFDEEGDLADAIAPTVVEVLDGALALTSISSSASTLSVSFDEEDLADGPTGDGTPFM